MRYVVLDTDVSSQILRRRLPSTLAARLAGTLPYVTFVTLGELTQWAELRNWGQRSRAGLEAWLSGVGLLEGDRDVARTWGRLSSHAHQRGRPRPVNDMWIAACCLTHGLPLATLNVKDFADFATYEGLELITA